MTPAFRLRPRHFAFTALSMLAIIWGALAFGAVYPWAYTPLAVVCAIAGTAMLIVERRRGPRLMPLCLGLAAIAVAIAVQLAPLPSTALARISPGTDAFLRQYDLAYNVGADAPDGVLADAAQRPTSIEPRKTALALGLFAAFALFFLGVTRLASAVGAATLVRAMVYFGIVLALIGIVQWAATSTQDHPLVYGFWRPRYGIRAFGPFINPNHFAGWMLMVLPLALAAFYETLVRTMDSMGRDRMATVGSEAFGSLLVFGVACMVMGLSLIMTLSRSGIGAFAVGSALACAIVLRRQASARARIAVVASFLVLLLGTAGWAGLRTVTEKFVTSDQRLDTVGGRAAVWRDTVDIARRFPLTGTGLDTFGVAMVLYQSGSRDVHFQEAHNDYLQLAAEGGLLVGVPILWVLIVFVREVRRRFQEAPKAGSTYWLRIGAVIGLVSIALQSLVEFSLQMPGNAALFAMLAAVAIHRSPNLRVADEATPRRPS